MSEMEYEELPEVHVPVIRSWPYDALGAWCDAFWGRRQGWFAFGCLFIALAIVAFCLKYAVFATGVIVILTVALLAMLWDLATYRSRLHRAQAEALAPYAREVFQTPRDESGWGHECG